MLIFSVCHFLSCAEYFFFSCAYCYTAPIPMTAYLHGLISCLRFLILFVGPLAYLRSAVAFPTSFAAFFSLPLIRLAQARRKFVVP